MGDNQCYVMIHREYIGKNGEMYKLLSWVMAWCLVYWTPSLWVPGLMPGWKFIFPSPVSAEEFLQKTSLRNGICACQLIRQSIGRPGTPSLNIGGPVAPLAPPPPLPPFLVPWEDKSLVCEYSYSGLHI